MTDLLPTTPAGIALAFVLLAAGIPIGQLTAFFGIGAFSTGIGRLQRSTALGITALGIVTTVLSALGLVGLAVYTFLTLLGV